MLIEYLLLLSRGNLFGTKTSDDYLQRINTPSIHFRTQVILITGTGGYIHYAENFTIHVCDIDISNCGITTYSQIGLLMFRQSPNITMLLRAVYSTLLNCCKSLKIIFRIAPGVYMALIVC